jgi:putative transcriptional regulator
MKVKNYESMSVYEQLMDALNEGLAHSRGEITLKTTILPVPAPTLSKRRVLAIRKKSGMSQSVLAAFLNVPKRTLESWEQGRRTPKAGEARLLQIVEADPRRFEALILSLGEPAARPRRKKAG